MSKKQKQSRKLHAAGEYHTSFQSPKVQHVESATEQWREMASILGNTEKHSYLANENLPQESSIALFGEMILYHTKKFEIHKNNHNINVFILKIH